MDSNFIAIDTSSPTARITINRPERHNALDLAMWKSIPQAVQAVETTPGVRSIVLQGAGDRAFVSGADISEFDKVRCDSKTNTEFTHHVVRATASIREARVPVIAAINGYCIGGGVVLACACDIRIATDDSTFAVPAARLGLGYERQNYAALTELVGRGNAAAIVMTARTFSAEDALRMGLVQDVVEKAALNTHISKLTADIANLAPLTLRAAKACSQSPREGGGATDAQAAIDRCFDSRDFAEGREAFRQKRRPIFTGQ